jgi:hypothetical protein
MCTEPDEEVTGGRHPILSLGDTQETVTGSPRCGGLRLGHPLRLGVDRNSQSQRYGAGYTQAIPTGSPEPLLNPCRLHITRKHTVTVADSDWALRDARPSISRRNVFNPPSLAHCKIVAASGKLALAALHHANKHQTRTHYLIVIPETVRYADFDGD